MFLSPVRFSGDWQEAYAPGEKRVNLAGRSARRLFAVRAPARPGRQVAASRPSLRALLLVVIGLFRDLFARATEFLGKIPELRQAIPHRQDASP